MDEAPRTGREVEKGVWAWRDWKEKRGRRVPSGTEGQAVKGE